MMCYLYYYSNKKEHTLRERNITGRIDGGTKTLIIRRSQEVVGSAADIEESRRVDNEVLSIDDARIFDDIPLILRWWMCIAAT